MTHLADCQFVCCFARRACCGCCGRRMRSPTPRDCSLTWWRDALTGFGSIVAKALEPQCGFYKRRLVHGGPFVPVRIYLEQEIDEATGELMADEVMRCEVNGERADPVEQWPRLWNNPIPESEFEYMTAARRWAAWYSLSDPAANPRKPLDNLTTPIRF
jgi:hypothetical protein